MRKYLILIVLLVLAIIGYNYIYQEHRNIESESPEFNLTAEALFSQFSENPSDSEKKYLNKTVQVKGIVSNIGEMSMVLNGNIFCQFQEPIEENVELKDFITLKGRCIGYDDLLEEIKLDQCSKANN